MTVPLWNKQAVQDVLVLAVSFPKWCCFQETQSMGKWLLESSSPWSRLFHVRAHARVWLMLFYLVLKEKAIKLGRWACNFAGSHPDGCSAAKHFAEVVHRIQAEIYEFWHSCDIISKRGRQPVLVGLYRWLHEKNSGQIIHQSLSCLALLQLLVCLKY